MRGGRLLWDPRTSTRARRQGFQVVRQWATWACPPVPFLPKEDDSRYCSLHSARVMEHVLSSGNQAHHALFSDPAECRLKPSRLHNKGSYAHQLEKLRGLYESDFETVWVIDAEFHVMLQICCPICLCNPKHSWQTSFLNYRRIRQYLVGRNDENRGVIYLVSSQICSILPDLAQGSLSSTDTVEPSHKDLPSQKFATRSFH